MRWRNACRRGGRSALRPRPTPGRPPRLTPGQRKRLVKYLVQGPLAHGFSTDLWTTARVAQLIRRRLGVGYHRDHVGRLLHAVGWTCQKPDQRAMQRDEAAIEAWKRKAWPRIKKNGAAGRPSRFPRRIRVPADSGGSPHLGAVWPNAVDPVRLQARPDLSHFRRDGQPAASPARAVCPVSSPEHPPGRSLRLSASSAAAPSWPPVRPLGQWQTPQG